MHWEMGSERANNIKHNFILFDLWCLHELFVFGKG
jgi:hypothetical protein